MKRTFGKILIATLVMPVAASCSKDLPVLEPTYSKVSDEIVRIEVQFETDDSQFIKNEEVYLNLTSHECGDGANRYSAEAYVGDSAVIDFDFPISTESSTFHGDVPAEVFSRYERPCLTLTGGSYLGWTVSSESVPIEPKVR